MFFYTHQIIPMPDEHGPRDVVCDRIGRAANEIDRLIVRDNVSSMWKNEGIID